MTSSFESHPNRSMSHEMIEKRHSLDFINKSLYDTLKRKFFGKGKRCFLRTTQDHRIALAWCRMNIKDIINFYSRKKFHNGFCSLYLSILHGNIWRETSIEISIEKSHFLVICFTISKQGNNCSSMYSFGSLWVNIVEDVFSDNFIPMD